MVPFNDAVAPLYRDGYRLLQSFTTGGTAQGLQSTPITPAALLALNGVLDLKQADGARLMFCATTGATSITAWVTGFEPILGLTGQPVAYVERPLSSTAAVALTLGTQVTTVTLDATASTGTLGGCWYGAAPSLLVIPTSALLVQSLGTLTGAQPGVAAFSAGAAASPGILDLGGIASAAAVSPGNSGLQGITHLRVLLSCATASQSVWCLAKRLQGQARR